MYVDYERTQPYDEHLMQQSRKFQDAQADATWVRHWLRGGVQRLGWWLVIWGQQLQSFGTDRHGGIRGNFVLVDPELSLSRKQD
jgi:hypothetical protein